ncbi:hypothetical protein CR513_47880, partial [Mucuna pruriens]
MLGDTSSFVSLCAKPEVKPNFESIDCCVNRVIKSKKQMENNERTLKELATPDIVYQPWCIQYPQLEPAQSYELKSGLIHLRRPPQAFEGIPYGLFHNEVVGDTRRLHENEGVPILLGWSSEGLAVSLACSLQHLGDMKCMFLEKFFLASRTATIRKEICGIRQ